MEPWGWVANFGFFNPVLLLALLMFVVHVTVCSYFKREVFLPFFFFFFFYPCPFSNIPKPIFSALVGEFLRIAWISHQYRETEKLWNCSIEWNHGEHSPSGVEKHYAKSFEGMKKHLLVFGKNCDEIYYELHI